MWPSTEHIEKDIKRSSFFHSKDGRCSGWGLLHYDDWRSPWWASRDGPQHDRSRSDTVIISMNFNSYASLVIYFIIPVLFCFVLFWFWARNFLYYTIIKRVWFLSSSSSLFALFYHYKNLFTAVVARGRGDPGSHRAYGRATSLTIINQVEKRYCEYVRPGQFSDYLSKNSCIFV